MQKSSRQLRTNRSCKSKCEPRFSVLEERGSQDQLHQPQKREALMRNQHLKEENCFRAQQ